MSPLVPPDSVRLQAAIGWLELGNHLEANEELEEITPQLRAHPDVLEIRWKIYARACQWEPALLLASAIIKLSPERASGYLMKSISLRQLGRIQDAWDFLLPVADQFPDVAGIAYDLACFACHLGHLSDSRRWLTRAFAGTDAKRWKLLALEDPDLEPFWRDIGSL